MNIIMDTLKEFRKNFQNVNIHIVLDNTSVLNDMKRLGCLDIIIKNNYEVFESFTKVKSFKVQDKFIVAKNTFKELEKGKHSLTELLNYPFVLLGNITNGRKNFDEYLKSKNINFKPTYEFNSYSLCKELIKNGFGIGVGNPMHYSDIDCSIIDTDFEILIRTFDIGYIKTSKNKYIEEFIKLLKIRIKLL